MQYVAEVDIMPLDALLDPAGKAVTHSMGTLGLSEISKVRIGKHIQITLEAESKGAAEQKVEEACKKLLANEIMEKFTFTVTELETA